VSESEIEIMKTLLMQLAKHIDRLSNLTRDLSTEIHEHFHKEGVELHDIIKQLKEVRVNDKDQEI